MRLSERYRTVELAQKYWGVPLQKLRYGQRVEELATWEKIRDATAAAIPLVSQT